MKPKITALFITATITLTSYTNIAHAESTHGKKDQPSVLKVKVYHADENSFSVNSTLITGETEAMVIDTGFTRADALRIAGNVLDSNKKLTTILVSQADPDYYFGVETLKQIFPDANVVATPTVLAEIKHKLPKKIKFWSPKMGANAPINPVLPKPLTHTTLTVDGQKIEIRGTTGELANRPYVWIPSLKTITGNVSVYNNMHVWMADSKTKASRQAWVAQLDEMTALNPRTVIAGHSHTAEGAMDVSAIHFTKNYLIKFEQALANSQNSKQLIQKMMQTYPNLADKSSLELGAKVTTGEMEW